MGYPMSIFLRLLLASSLVTMGAMAAVADTPTSTYTPVCFMQTETGQMIDLSHLCGSTDEQATSQTQTVQANPVPQRGRGRGAARRGVY